MFGASLPTPPKPLTEDLLPAAPGRPTVAFSGTVGDRPQPKSLRALRALRVRFLPGYLFVYLAAFSSSAVLRALRGSPFAPLRETPAARLPAPPIQPSCLKNFRLFFKIGHFYRPLFDLNFNGYLGATSLVSRGTTCS